MDYSHDLVLDQQGQIKYLSIHCLDLMYPEKAYLFGYKANQIKNRDLVVIIENNFEQHKSFYLNQLFERLMIDFKRLGNKFVLIFLYQEDDVQPICKSDYSKTMLDTVFNGLQIMISHISEESVLIEIDNSKYILPLSQIGRQMFIFDGQVAKYFIGNTANNEKINRVMNGEEFEGEFNFEPDILNHNSLETLFEKEFCIFLKDFILSAKFKGCYFKERYYLVHRNEGLDQSFIHLDITTEERCMHAIEKNSLQLNFFSQRLCDGKIEVDFSDIIGNSPIIQRIKTLITKASVTNATILLLGESGTGKTFFAREIHMKSKRNQMKFMHINCAAIPPTLIESELFGYEEGAFTGAKKGGKKGYFEVADGGTLFLDEVGELPLESQSRLLEVLQSGTFYRVGGNEKITVNIRVIAATNKNLKTLVHENRFRKDLYYRLSVFPINVPPLRDRMSDIKLLCNRLLPEITRRLEINPLILSEAAIRKMMDYDWPGNIRELENILEQASILCEGKVICPEHIMISNPSQKEDMQENLRKRMEQHEKLHIIRTLDKYGGNKSKTAGALGIGRTTLFEKMKRYNIEQEENDDVD